MVITYTISSLVSTKSSASCLTYQARFDFCSAILCLYRLIHEAAASISLVCGAAQRHIHNVTAKSLGSWCLSFAGPLLLVTTDTSTSHRKLVSKQQTLNRFTATGSFPLSGWSLHASCGVQCLLNTNAGSVPSVVEASHATKEAQLIELGFTVDQAKRLLSFFASRRTSLSVENVSAWLKLLHRYHVVDTYQTASKHPIILASRAARAAANAEGVVEWFSSLGMAPGPQAALLGKYPMLLNVPSSTASAATEWFGSQLTWSSSKVVCVLTQYPDLFNHSCENLQVKLAWFLSNGLRIDMISRKPHLLRRNLFSIVNQTKVRFLTQVMMKDVVEMERGATFLTYSLLERTGPRWAFHSKHCSHQSFCLSTRLNPIDEDFVQQLPSSSLDAECASRRMTRMQLFEECKTSWQQGEGKDWVVGRTRKGRKNMEGL